MTAKSTSIVILLLAVALGVGAVGRDRIWRSSTGAARSDAGKQSPHAPPVAPDVTSAAPAQSSPPAAAGALPPPPARPAAATAPPEPPAHMSLAQQADFDSWMIKSYLRCWKPAAQPPDVDSYVAHVRLAFKPDGSLMKPPKLVNPPSDPALKPQAKSVLQAVQTCNPLPVPAQYRPFYEQWKTKTIHFNPQVAAR